MNTVQGSAPSLCIPGRPQEPPVLLGLRVEEGHVPSRLDVVDDADGRRYACRAERVCDAPDDPGDETEGGQD